MLLELYVPLLVSGIHLTVQCDVCDKTYYAFRSSSKCHYQWSWDKPYCPGCKHLCPMLQFGWKQVCVEDVPFKTLSWSDRIFVLLKQTRQRSETHWKVFLYLDFRSYFEATSPNWFNVFCKILLQSIFLARIINKNKPKSHQLILYLVQWAIGWSRNVGSHLVWWVSQVSRFKPRASQK